MFPVAVSTHIMCIVTRKEVAVVDLFCSGRAEIIEILEWQEKISLTIYLCTFLNCLSVLKACPHFQVIS